MFPYPSGAGLHVGHPLGYIASDIVSRYYRHKGYNVLHPQGYDSFGLPAEQYAIQTGQHPATTTKNNIARYRKQLDRMGFSFDWSREIRTSNPDYYEKVEKVKHDSPSIINLIPTIEEDGYKLEKITQGIELDLEGNLPVIRNNAQQNFGVTTLTLDNNNRVMLWFKKE